MKSRTIRCLAVALVGGASVFAGGCMDPTYVMPRSTSTAHLSITHPSDLSFSFAASRVMIAYAYADTDACRDAQRMVTFPRQQEGSVEIPAGREFPMLFYTFDRNVACQLVGGFTPQAGHSYVAHMLEKPPSFWSRVAGAIAGGATDGQCGVTFEEQLPDGTSRDIPYFIMGAMTVPGSTASCDRAHRSDMDPAAARATH